MSKLSATSLALARTRPRAYEAEPELPHLPPPMTANRSKDFGHNLTNGCTSCGTRCDYCVGWDFPRQ